MGNLVWFLAIIYFVAIILVLYHLQQQELDRIQRQIEELALRNKFGES